MAPEGPSAGVNRKGRVSHRTLTDVGKWANSEIADADIATVVAREKTRPGKDMVIFAGARFAQTALAAGVVDELSLLVIPNSSATARVCSRATRCGATSRLSRRD